MKLVVGLDKLIA